MCGGDLPKAIDTVLSYREQNSRYKPNRNNSNRTAASHPITHTHVSSNSNNMTTVEPSRVQTPHTMPSINQTITSNSHVNQNPAVNNNYMFMQTPVFDQESNISPPSQCICNSNQFSAPESRPVVPNDIPNLFPVQTTSTHQPFTEESQPMLHPPLLHSDMPHTLSYVKNANTSNVHCHHLNQSPQIFIPNLAPAIQQENECSHLAACNTSERPRNSTNQATHETMTEIYAEQQEESWLQQQQQQCGGHKMLDLVNNIQPLIADHSHQDAEEASMSLRFLLSSHDTVQTVSIAEHVQCQEGKQIIQCFLHVCIFYILQCHLIFGEHTYISA